jgi:hypothetical protein
MRVNLLQSDIAGTCKPVLLELPSQVMFAGLLTDVILQGMQLAGACNRRQRCHTIQIAWHCEHTASVTMQETTKVKLRDGQHRHGLQESFQWQRCCLRQHLGCTWVQEKPSKHSTFHIWVFRHPAAATMHS